MRSVPEDVRSAAVLLSGMRQDHAERLRALFDHLAPDPAGADPASQEQARLFQEAAAAHYRAHVDANQKIGDLVDALEFAAAKAEGTDAANASTLGASTTEARAAREAEAIGFAEPPGASSRGSGERPTDPLDISRQLRTRQQSGPTLSASADAHEGFAAYCGGQAADELGQVRALVGSGMGDATGDLVEHNLGRAQTWFAEQPAGLGAVADQGRAAAASHARAVDSTHAPHEVESAWDHLMGTTAAYRQGKVKEPELDEAKAKYRLIAEQNKTAYGAHEAATPAGAGPSPDPAPHLAAQTGTGGSAAAPGDQWSPDGLDEADELDPQSEQDDQDNSEETDGKDDQAAPNALAQIGAELASALGQGVSAVGQAISGAVGQGVGALNQAGQGVMSAAQGLASGAKPAATNAAADLGDELDGLDDGLGDDDLGIGDGGDSSTSPMGAAGGDGGSAAFLGQATGQYMEPLATRAATATVAAGPPTTGAGSQFMPPMMPPGAKAEEKEHKRRTELSWVDAAANLEALVPVAGPHGEVGAAVIGAPSTDNSAGQSGKQEGAA